MSLRDREWDGYYPGHSDHLNEFFIPAFQKSTQYDRITGDFSSSIISIFSEGLKDFIDNGGTIRLMTGVELFPSDIDAIERGQTGDVLAEKIDWDEVAEGHSEKVLEALAWLIANDILEIKIGAVLDDDGQPRGSDWGQWHQKVVIFSDADRNSISVVGSPNESFKALQRNRESIDVNRSWVEHPTEDWDEKRKVKSHRREFNNLWDDHGSGARVFDFPEAARAEIIEYKPRYEPDWDEVAKEVEKDTDGPTPYPYQERAINLFQENDHRIVLEHATGTGKTWSSLFATKDIATENSVIVILAPTTDLVEQWASNDNVGQFFPDSVIVQCTGEETWAPKLYDMLVAKTRTAPVVAISTMHPVTLEKLFGTIIDHSDPEDRILIADEVHNMGSEQRRERLEEFYAGARIGLSATPERGDEGDEFIEEYFGSVTDTITLEEAIEDYEVLSEYEYHIHTVSLNEFEREDYNELSKEIAQKYLRYKSYDGQDMMEVADMNPPLRGVIMERARVLKECQAKDAIAADALKEIGSKTLVFCNTRNHARRVKDLMDETTSRRIGLFFGSLSQDERDGFMSDFRGDFIDTLVSIDVLNEGINVPICDSAILIANSMSEREAVQRRGRVLRKAEEEKRAQIHDFITLPVDQEVIKHQAAELTSAEITLIHKELDRVERMNEAAWNRERNDLQIISLRNAVALYK